MKTQLFYTLLGLFLLGISLKAQTVLDVDENVYKTVKIGEQTWMAENLKTERFNNGEAIPLVIDGKDLEDLITPAYCWYDNNKATYKDTYGALYNWYAVNTEKLCPTGWHIPTDAEWTVLERYIVESQNKDGSRFIDVKQDKPIAIIDGVAVYPPGSYIADELKETGNKHWKVPDHTASNSSGFTALPGGMRYGDGVFKGIGISARFWTSTESDNAYYDYAWTRGLYYDYPELGRHDYGKYFSFSVRCIKD